MRHVLGHEVFILQTDITCCPFRKGVGMDLEECGIFLLRRVFFFPSIQSVYIIWSPINEISSVGIQVGVSPASWKCSEEFFSHQIKNRDPLKLGFVSNFSCFC